MPNTWLKRRLRARVPARVRSRRIVVLCALACGGTLGLSPALAGARLGRSHLRMREDAHLVNLSLNQNARRIPRGFLGMSMEYGEVGVYERQDLLFGRVLSLLRAGAGEPVSLRVGGRSADRVDWDPDDGPAWERAITLGPTWLSHLADLVRRDNLRVLLDLNLAVHDAGLEAGFAAAARRALPHGVLQAVEIGNEPDLYADQPDLAQERTAGTTAPRQWTAGYSADAYRRDFHAYARRLARAVPHVPLAGPATIFSPDPKWLRAVQDEGRLSAGVLTVHRYIGTACPEPGSSYKPSLGMLLRATSVDAFADSATPAVSSARRHHESVRIDEVNSFSCGGARNVSDSFASALWAPSILFGFLEDGVQGVNWEMRPDTVNSPFLVRNGQITPEPSLYGLALFAQMTPPGADLVGVTESRTSADCLPAWATRSGSTLRVLVINRCARRRTVRLGQVAPGHAWVRWLEASAPGATFGTRLAGRSISPQGRWAGGLRVTRLRIRSRAVRAIVPSFSGALITVRR